MTPYITEKGNQLYYRVYYDIGGSDYITNRDTRRGYRLSVRRKPNIFSAHSDLHDEQGAVTLFLHEVTRKSKKQETIATTIALEKLPEIANRYNL